MLKSKGPVDPALAGPVPHWALQQETWPCSHGGTALPLCSGEMVPPLDLGELAGWLGPRRAGSAPCLRGVVLVAWTDLLSYHPLPRPVPWPGPP